MYAAAMGFLITFILGLILSVILKIFKKQGVERIYIDDSKTIMNPDLFMPPKAMRVRQRNLKYEEKMMKKDIDKYLDKVDFNQ